MCREDGSDLSQLLRLVMAAPRKSSPHKNISPPVCHVEKHAEHVWQLRKDSAGEQRTRDASKRVGAGQLSDTFQRPLPSAHQITRAVFPQHPSVWRTPFKHGIDHRRIVLQPEAAHRHPSSVLLPKDPRKKLHIKLDQHVQKLEVALPALVCDPVVIDHDSNQSMWQRLQDLSTSLVTSPREQDQKRASQALGSLGFRNDFILEALHQALGASKHIHVRYEVVKSLALLGCMDAAVINDFLRFLQAGNDEVTLDLLGTLRSVLQKKASCDPSQRASVDCQSGLTSVLEGLVVPRDHGDEIPVLAATCLAFLDEGNETALRYLTNYLHDEDLDKKMKALPLLVKWTKVHTNVVIRVLLHQLLHSKIYKHRIEACRLLMNIGLQRIQEEGLEEEVFEALKMKLNKEPLMNVKQVVGEAADALGMKPLMWDLAERQLKAENEVLRRQAVNTLSTLGLRNKRILRLLLEMLDLDPSKGVRVEIIRMASALRMKEPSMLRKLQLKVEGEGVLARAAAKALRNIQKNDDQKLTQWYGSTTPIPVRLTPRVSDTQLSLASDTAPETPEESLSNFKIYLGNFNTFPWNPII